LNKIISIVTPSLNQGAFIERTIQSVLSQAGTFYIDYNIVDGGSTDNTVEIIKTYERHLQSNACCEMLNGLKFYRGPGCSNSWPRCSGVSYRWSSEQDNGQSAALNRGFRESVGGVLAWINSDDYYLEGVFQKVYEAFGAHPVAAVMGNAAATDHLGRIVWQQCPGIPSWFSFLYLRIGPPQAAMFFTKRLWDRAGGIDDGLHYAMDGDLWCRFLRVKAKFVKIEKLCAVQTYHPAAKSCQGNYWYERFEPECRRVVELYRRLLGIKHYWLMAGLRLLNLYWRTYYAIATLRSDLFGYSPVRPAKILQGREID
jgi:glycosyltransferase involved in cell wall biosynthesis